MANKPFDREVINIRERPLSSDINLVQSYADLELRRLAVDMQAAARSAGTADDQNTLRPFGGTAGFYGSSFRVRAQVGMSVSLDAGLGFLRDGIQRFNIGGISGVNDTSGLKPLPLDADLTLGAGGIGIIPVGDPGNPRIDLIEVSSLLLYKDPTSRDTLDIGTGTFLAGAVNKTLSYSLDGLAEVIPGVGLPSQPIVYKVGTPAGVPVQPPVDAGYVRIATIKVPALAVSITGNTITDYRRFILPSGQFKASGYFFLPAGGAGTPPAGVSLVAPPGMSVAVQRASGSTAILYLICGDSGQFQGLSGLMTPRSIGGADGVFGSGGTFPLAQLYSLTGPEATSITSGTDVFPNIPVAEGQNVIKMIASLAFEAVAPTSTNWYWSIEGQQ